VPGWAAGGRLAAGACPRANAGAALAAGSCLAAEPVMLVCLFARRSVIAGLVAGSLAE
jgi:ABC-type glycerol-3-phosphate transport system permease component